MKLIKYLYYILKQTYYNWYQCLINTDLAASVIITLWLFSIINLSLCYTTIPQQIAEFKYYSTHN